MDKEFVAKFDLLQCQIQESIDLCLWLKKHYRNNKDDLTEILFKLEQAQTQAECIVEERY